MLLAQKSAQLSGGFGMLGDAMALRAAWALTLRSLSPQCVALSC